LQPVERFKDHLTRATATPQKLLRFALVLGNQPGIGERREDVLRVFASDAIEVEVGRVKFGTMFRSLLFLPDMDPVTARALEFACPGEGNHVLGRAGEFQHPLADPVLQGFTLRPRALVGIGVRRQRGELFDDEEIERDVSDLAFRINRRDNLVSEWRVGR